MPDNANSWLIGGLCFIFLLVGVWAILTGD